MVSYRFRKIPELLSAREIDINNIRNITGRNMAPQRTDHIGCLSMRSLLLFTDSLWQNAMHHFRGMTQTGALSIIDCRPAARLLNQLSAWHADNECLVSFKDLRNIDNWGDTKNFLPTTIGKSVDARETRPQNTVPITSLPQPKPIRINRTQTKSQK